MAEFLSQDEIDALLDIADEDGGLEEIPEETGPTTKDKSYAIYDFKKPNRISAEQMKAFNALHDKMLRSTISELSAMLRKIVDVKLYSIEQMTYGEFILSIPQITSLNTLSMKPLEGRIVMECNPAISHKIIAHLLGNGDSSLTDSTEKELTEIELEVFNHFYQLIIKNLKKAWDDVSTMNLRTESMDTNANAIQIISDHEIVLLVVFEITIDDESGFLSICYPISYIESLLAIIVEKVFAEAKNRKVSKKRDINALISGSQMKIEVMLAETELPVKELLDLRKDDIIMFSKNANSASTKVYINNKEKWSAVAGASNNRKAIQIKSNIDHEKMETLQALKQFSEERASRVKKANETIAKLISEKNDI